MPKLQLFEYSVVYHFKPVRDNAQNDITPDSIIILPPERIMAPDDKTVGKKVARLIPATFKTKDGKELDLENQMEQCEVIIHPF